MDQHHLQCAPLYAYLQMLRKGNLHRATARTAKELCATACELASVCQAPTICDRFALHLTLAAPLGYLCCVLPVLSRCPVFVLFHSSLGFFCNIIIMKTRRPPVPSKVHDPHVTSQEYMQSLIHTHIDAWLTERKNAPPEVDERYFLWRKEATNTHCYGIFSFFGGVGAFFERFSHFRVTNMLISNHVVEAVVSKSPCFGPLNTPPVLV